MATAKKAADSVRLTHVNGGTVAVPAEKAERLVAGGLFTAETPKRSTAKASE